jgi:hypothetical protein
MRACHCDEEIKDSSGGEGRLKMGFINPGL